MSLITKTFVYGTVFIVASVMHPEGTSFGVLALMGWIVLSWAWGRRRARSGRVVPVLLLLAVPWLAFGQLTGANGASAGVADSLETVTATLALIYAIYLGFLFLLDGVFGLMGGERGSQKKIFKRFWWF